MSEVVAVTELQAGVGDRGQGVDVPCDRKRSRECSRKPPAIIPTADLYDRIGVVPVVEYHTLIDERSPHDAKGELLTEALVVPSDRVGDGEPDPVAVRALCLDGIPNPDIRAVVPGRS